MRSRHSAIKELAEVLRSTYIELRRMYELHRVGGNGDWQPGNYWDGGKWRGQNRSSIWESAAAKLLDKEINVRRFVTFVVFNREGGPPNYLASDKVLDEYCRWAGNEETESSDIIAAEARKRCELNTLQVAFNEFASMRAEGLLSEELSDRDLRHMALGSGNVAISPLLRYCLARADGFDDLAQKFYPLALTQYRIAFRLYDKVWAELISDDLRA